MVPKRCSRCNVNKEDDELLCQVCTHESLRKGKPREDPKENLKIIYVLYKNLADKLKVKKKTVNDKPEIRFRLLQSVSWILAEFRHNKIVQSPHKNYFNVCRQHKEK